MTMTFMLSESYALIPTCEAASKYFGPKFVDGKLTKLFPPARSQLRRVDDWQPRLRRVLKQNQATTYRFGLFDCVYLCGQAIEAVTGHLLRFEYEDMEGSQRFKQGLGGSLVDVWGSLLGPPRQGDALAVDGDIGLINNGYGLTSVFLFEGRLWGPSLIGFAWYRRDKLLMHWPVGDYSGPATTSCTFVPRPPDRTAFAAVHERLREERHKWTAMQIAKMARP